MSNSRKKPSKNAPKKPVVAPMPVSTTDTDLAEYRQTLVDAEQKSQEAFDKTVLSLSGGALGISFVFLKDVIGTTDALAQPVFLIAAWLSWAGSSLAVLLSFWFSHLALRKAIEQVDAGTIRQQKAGGAYSVVTKWLNIFGATMFFVGVCAITTFASKNLSKRENADAKKSAITTVAQPPSTSPSSLAAPAAPGPSQLPGP